MHKFQTEKQNKASIVPGFKYTRDYYRENMIVNIVIIENKDFCFFKCWFFQNMFILVFQIFPLYSLSGSI